jgi:molybdenum cofactor cytidylyltransferase
MTAIILAAGLSKRFGSQKLCMPINNRPMVQHVIELAKRMNFEECILVYQDEEVRRLAGDGIKCVYNPNAADGLSSSVKCGAVSAGKTDGYIFFVGDQPFIDEQTIRLLVDTFYNKPIDVFQKEAHKNIGSILVPMYNGKRGNPVIFASKWKVSLENLTGDAGGRTIIEQNPEQIIFVDMQNGNSGEDIDTLEDYKKFEFV